MLQKALLGCLVVSNIEKGESGGFLSRRKRAEFTPRKKVGNFHVSQRLLSMMTLLLLAKWIFMNYRTILNNLNGNETPKIPDIR